MSFWVPRPGGFHLSELMTVEEALSLKEERTLFLESTIQYESIAPITDALLFLDKINHEPIKLIIFSYGGIVELGLILYDVIQSVQSPIYTIGRTCASLATVILAAGEKNHRYIYPHSRVMLHLPYGGFEGDPEDIKRQVAEFEKFKEILVDLLIKHGCPKGKEEILKDIDREFWLRGEEAVGYGLVDKVITPEIHKELFGKPFKVKFPTKGKSFFLKEKELSSKNNQGNNEEETKDKTKKDIL